MGSLRAVLYVDRGTEKVDSFGRAFFPRIGHLREHVGAAMEGRRLANAKSFPDAAGERGPAFGTARPLGSLGALL